MGSSSSLHFDPVSCIVTIVAGESDEMRVFGVTSDSGVVYSVEGTRQHFAVVHGSVVYVGRLTSVVQDAAAAVIFDLPDGRRRATGTARVYSEENGVLHARIDAQTHMGERLTLNVQCHREDDRLAHSLSATS